MSFVSRWGRWLRAPILAAGLLGGGAVSLAAQDVALIEALAPVLAAEDARRFDSALFARALTSPEPLVRRTAALAVGRIGDWRGTELVIRLLTDPDSTVPPVAAFALGLLRDTSAVTPLIERLSDLPVLSTEGATEAITALARIGGDRVGEYFGGVLENRAPLEVPDTGAVRLQIVREAWQLGAAAPVDALLPFLRDSGVDARSYAVYTLGRLRAPAAADEIMAALRDETPLTRSYAARALTRRYADTAGLDPATVADLLARAVDDEAAGVRIDAMRSLGTYDQPEHASRVALHLNDQALNARVQAAMTLGWLGGPAAVEALSEAVESRELFPVRRAALLGLARLDSTAFEAALEPWRTSDDWRERAVAAEALVVAGRAGPELLDDSDGRVVAAALQAWAGAVDGPAPALLAAARSHLKHPDAAVRSIAAGVVARAADPADLRTLVAAYRMAEDDSFPDATLSVLDAVAAIAERSETAEMRARREFLASVPRPENYLFRLWAEESWPAARARWGAAYPIETGRTLEDYREIARTYLVDNGPQSRPRVFIETEQRGTIEVELFGQDAPLTVANFLRLVNRRFFDGNRWHRVIPNFVVQDGDPRGDGWGGAGGTIRDEINRHRYIKPVLGMALSGPETGSSQWFINLSPQPHLDGVYTIFGQVVDGTAALNRIVEGDLIRTIRQ